MNTTQPKTRTPTFTFQMMARLAAAHLLAALLVPSASAQFIYVANAGEDTVSKIDINSNTEVARIATWFTAGTNHIVHPSFDPWTGPAPSRIAQDSAGDIYVLDRFFPSNSGGGAPAVPPMHLPVLLKIAPTNGPVLPLLDTTPTDNHIQPVELTDTRIKWASEIGIPGTDEGALGRAVCIDTTGNLWVGMHYTRRYYKVSAATGAMLPPLAGILTPGHTPYGCEVDAKGTLWSVDERTTLAEINTFTNQVTIHNHATPKDYGNNYSLSIFNGCGSAPSKVYLSEMTAKTYIAYDPQTSSFSAAPLAIPQFESLAIGVDLSGNIVSGKRFTTGRVIKTDPVGNLLWDTNALGSTVPAQDIRGVIRDKNDDFWVVHLYEDRVVKYSGATGAWLATVPVGKRPYTYGNAPPPTCPCAVTSEPQIKCEGKDKNGKWLYSWSFVVTNHSPFSAPATTVNISTPNGSPVTDLTPAQFTFQNPVPPNGQATVSGTFTLAQPMVGTKICLDIRLNAGDGWCCPLEQVCFEVPDCTCASLQGVFKCSHGRRYLELSVTNLGPTAAAGVQVFSNTAGVMVTPSMTMQNFPQNTAVPIHLTVTGAAPGQVISLTVNLHGPIDPKTGVYSWCCMAVIKVTYPEFGCHWWPDGWVWDDINANGIRDSAEGGLPEWTVTLTDAKGKLHTTKSDASGKYQFEEIEPGKYRLSVQPPKGWRATTSKGGVNALSVEAPPKEGLDFGFVKTR